MQLSRVSAASVEILFLSIPWASDLVLPHRGSGWIAEQHYVPENRQLWNFSAGFFAHAERNFLELARFDPSAGEPSLPGRCALLRCVAGLKQRLSRKRHSSLQQKDFLDLFQA
jgi:hypothetical protein